MKKARPIKWNFSAITRAGNRYVIAYHNRWDPEKKQSRRASTVHVGALLPGGRVKVADGFLEKFPEYVGQTLYFHDRKLIERAQMESEYPELIEDEEFGAEGAGKPEPWRDPVVSFGLSWAGWQLLEQQGICRDLEAIFGEECANRLAQLAIYYLCGGTTLLQFEQWNASHYLPKGEPIDARRLSELLADVTDEAVENYFKQRYAKRQSRKKDVAPLLLALDSTSISTYSDTVAEAAYGYAKRDAHLRQINLTLVCDEENGEVVYAYHSNGSINDRAAFSDIIGRMKMAEFDLENTIFVTDRGYDSYHNIQCLIDCDARFIQGIVLNDKQVKDTIRSNMDFLTRPSLIHPELGIHCHTVLNAEQWLRRTSAPNGKPAVRTHLHLYRDAERAADEQRRFVVELDQIYRHKNGLELHRMRGDKTTRRIIPPEMIKTYLPYLKEERAEDGKVRWVKRDARISDRLDFMGCFAIKTSNNLMDPVKCLDLYRSRAVVEQAFRQFKSNVNGDRLYVTESSMRGRLFALMLAQGLRMMMMKRAKRTVKALPELKVRMKGDSLEWAMGTLRRIHAQWRSAKGFWFVEKMSKAQEETLLLLGLKLKERIYRN